MNDIESSEQGEKNWTPFPHLVARLKEFVWLNYRDRTITKKERVISMIMASWRHRGQNVNEAGTSQLVRSLIVHMSRRRKKHQPTLEKKGNNWISSNGWREKKHTFLIRRKCPVAVSRNWTLHILSVYIYIIEGWWTKYKPAPTSINLIMDLNYGTFLMSNG